MVMVRKIFLLFFFTYTLASCSKPKLDSLIKDDSFTYDRLQMGHLLIALPVKNAEVISQHIASLNSSELRQVTARTTELLREERERLKIKPIYAHKRNNSKILKGIQAAFTENKDLTEKDFDLLARTFMKFPDPYRYMLILRIAGEKNWQDYKKYTTTETKQKKNNDGEKIDISENYQHNDYYSYRKVDVNGIIVDLKRKTVVWDGLSNHTAYNANKNRRKIGDNSFIINVNQSNSTAYPSYPGVNETLYVAIEKIAVNLPDDED